MRLRHVLFVTVVASSFLSFTGQAGEGATNGTKATVISPIPIQEAKIPLFTASVLLDRYLHSEEPKQADEPKEEPLTVLKVEATAYTADCRGCIGITKAGIDVRKKITYKGRRIIATDPKIIPLGTVVVIDDVEYVAADTGGAIKGKKIDILVDSYEEAIQFGRRKNVEVIVTNKLISVKDS